MSTFFPFDLACTQCGKSFKVELLSSIHASRLPDARQHIIDGTFQLYQCPACSSPVAVECPLVYTDFDRDQYVAMEPSAHGDPHGARQRHIKIFNECFVYAPAVAQELGRPLRKRLVFGLRALREKLVLWEAGLDDVVVEGTKALTLEELGIPVEDTLLRLERVIEGGHLLFGMFAPGEPRLDESSSALVSAPLPGAHDFVTAPRERYRAVADDTAAVMGRYPWLGEDWVVDIHGGPG